MRIHVLTAVNIKTRELDVTSRNPVDARVSEKAAATIFIVEDMSLERKTVCKQ
jgi:hypothetical protein